jgi:translocator protein
LAVPIFVASVLVVLVLAIGGWTTTVGAWYRELRKPSCVLAWTDAVDDRPGRVMILALFGVNIVLHMLWSPLFFALKRPDWALIEVPFLWLSIVALLLEVGRYLSSAVWLLLPYLLWVTFAAFLNLKIVRLNRPFGERAWAGNQTSRTAEPRPAGRCGRRVGRWQASLRQDFSAFRHPGGRPRHRR